MVTSLGVTPGSSLVTTTLLSPSQILIGGNSRLVGVNPENTRFISLCIRRSSTKGSKPNRGNSERAMASPPCMLTRVWPRIPTSSAGRKGVERILAPITIAADVRPYRTGGVGNDHILATKRHDRGRATDGPTGIPCRDPTSGIRHSLDLVIPRRQFKLL